MNFEYNVKEGDIANNKISWRIENTPLAGRMFRIGSSLITADDPFDFNLDFAEEVDCNADVQCRDVEVFFRGTKFEDAEAFCSIRHKCTIDIGSCCIAW